ncbi:MAG: hypothetical protein EU550_02385 [Promethearchaeota archaeon]|nr:MAG: hypothetical protein EU550_02385 [Candidatus Lokiarchaeota archaeon]
MDSVLISSMLSPSYKNHTVLNKSLGYMYSFLSILLFLSKSGEGVLLKGLKRMKIYSSLPKMTHPIEQSLRELSKKYDVPYEELVSRFREIDEINRQLGQESNRERQKESLNDLTHKLRVERENREYEEFPKEDNIESESSIIERVVERARVHGQKAKEARELKERLRREEQRKRDQLTWFSEMYWKEYDKVAGSTERVTCPMCGAVGHRVKVMINTNKKIDEVEGKPIFARRYICKMDGYEWDDDTY